MSIREETWPAVGTCATALAAAFAGLPLWGVVLGAITAALGAVPLMRRFSHPAPRPASHPAASDGDAPEDLRLQLQRRDEQLAYTAHELRTPLASVVTALDVLRQGYVTTPAETEEFLDLAATAAQHLVFLVNDVLDDAALKTGQLRLSREVRPVGDLLGEAGRILQLQARARGIALRIDAVDPELRVHTDPRRFLQIVFNLVGNALKFSPAGGTVCVKVEPSPQHVRFLVVDEGPGVPPAARARLFEPFASAAVAPGRTIQGTGLGLFVCRRLAEQLGGAIGHEPSRERGSVFWFDQPRTTAPVLAATQ